MTRVLLRTVRVAPAAFLVMFFAWPVTAMLAAHLRWAAVADVLADSSMREVAWFTLWQAVASTALALAVGMPVTWALSRWRFAGSRLLTGLVTVPFLMPAVVMATGVAALLPSRGIPAILWAHTAFNVAVVVRVVGPVWSMVDRAQLESAASLGAPPWRVFTDISWPAIRDAARNATGLVFAFCFSSFAVVRILGGATLRTLETEVFVQAMNLGDVRTATALTVVQSVVVLGVLATGRGGRAGAVESHDIAGAAPLSERASWRWAPPVTAALGATVVCAPLVAVAARS
ncbi:MAG: ABC transporter permease, partial [Acidimicrobiales bacterium]